MAQRAHDRIWFKAKRYGWGWTPCCWQGWFATATYAVAFGVVLGYWLKEGRLGDEPLWSIGPLLLLTAGFFLLCWTRGEKLRWQWGGKR